MLKKILILSIFFLPIPAFAQSEWKSETFDIESKKQNLSHAVDRYIGLKGASDIGMIPSELWDEAQKAEAQSLWQQALAEQYAPRMIDLKNKLKNISVENRKIYFTEIGLDENTDYTTYAK